MEHQQTLFGGETIRPVTDTRGTEVCILATLERRGDLRSKGMNDRSANATKDTSGQDDPQQMAGCLLLMPFCPPLSSRADLSEDRVCSAETALTASFRAGHCPVTEGRSVNYRQVLRGGLPGGLFGGTQLGYGPLILLRFPPSCHLEHRPGIWSFRCHPGPQGVSED